APIIVRACEFFVAEHDHLVICRDDGADTLQLWEGEESECLEEDYEEGRKENMGFSYPSLFGWIVSLALSFVPLALLSLSLSLYVLSLPARALSISLSLSLSLSPSL